MKRATTLLLALVMVFTLAAISPAAMAEDNFGTGTIEDNVYWNETMKIGCALDETWYFYSEEEIMETNGLTADMLEGKIAEMIENGGAITDMFAQNMETGATLNVVFERVSLANSLLYNEKNYIEASTATVEEALTQMGIEDVAFTVQEAEFLGGNPLCRADHRPVQRCSRLRAGCGGEGRPEFYRCHHFLCVGRGSGGSALRLLQ